MSGTCQETFSGPTLESASRLTPIRTTFGHWCRSGTRTCRGRKRCQAAFSGYDYRWTSDDGFERGAWINFGISVGAVFIPGTSLSEGRFLPEPIDGRLQPGPSAYETMAFLSRSQAMPIGTMVVSRSDDVPSVFQSKGQNIDIRPLGLTEDYDGEWPGHSFQFNFDAATTERFWRRVVTLMAQEGA